MTCSDNTCGTGIGSLILPGDPDNNSILTASPAFGGVEISWTLPSTNPQAIAYVKVFRGLTSSFNAALYIAAASGDRYFDRFDWSTSIATPLYYWIQIVSVNGTIGEPIGPASAVPRRTIDEVIEQLTAQISYGMLSVALKGTVDKAELYKQAQDAVNSDLSSEQISIRDAVALVQNDVDQAFVLISNEIEARQSAGTAFASQLNTLAVSTGDNLATVQQTLQASINGVSDAVDEIGALYTVKVTVRSDGKNLIGGFGVYNDGSTVQAGFDVDTFWIGKQVAGGVNRKFPFIVQNNEVFMDEAVVNKLTFTKLIADDGSLIVSNGKIQGDYIKVKELEVGNSPAISGRTMTGSGARVHSDGKFAFGKAAGNIVYNGTDVFLNGFTSQIVSIEQGTYGETFPANTAFHTKYTAETVMTGFDVTRPLMVFVSGQLGLWLSSYQNAKPPGRADLQIRFQYKCSTDGGVTYPTYWSNDYNSQINMYALAETRYTITGTNRNFYNSGAASGTLVLPSNCTHFKFRVERWYRVTDGVNATNDAYFGAAAGSTAPLNTMVFVDSVFDNLSVLVFQVKV